MNQQRSSRERTLALISSGIWLLAMAAYVLRPDELWASKALNLGIGFSVLGASVVGVILIRRQLR